MMVTSRIKEGMHRLMSLIKDGILYNDNGKIGRGKDWKNKYVS